MYTLPINHNCFVLVYVMCGYTNAEKCDLAASRTNELCEIIMILTYSTRGLS